MKYGTIMAGRFLARPNRFLALVEIGGAIETVHVKNTSRCRELLVEGAAVYLEKSGDPGRKTGYSLVSVVRDGRLFNIDSQAPNKVCIEGILSGRIELPGLDLPIRSLRPEKKHGDSRLDIYIETGADDDRRGEAYIEVKGVTLEEDGIARFPDAPTERGLKHVNELRRIARAGGQAYIVFILQMAGSDHFEPNERMHPAFAEALRSAAKEGVRVLAHRCIVTEDTIEAADAVPVVL